MPWSGTPPNETYGRDNGTYTGTTVWQQDESAAVGIEADRHDTHDQDIATALNLALKKDGGNQPSADIDWNGKGIYDLKYLGSETEASIASATTTEVLGSTALFNSVTGTTTITSLGTGAELVKFVRFTGALTLTHNATSLILPGGANITTAAGDTMIVISDGSSNVRVLAYQRASGGPVLLQLADADGIYDDSGNEQLIFQKTASAVNYVEFTNAASGGRPLIAAAGDASDVTLELNGKGTGGITFTDQLVIRPYLRDYAEVINAIGDFGGGSQAIDYSAGNVASATVSTSEVTFTFTNPPITGRAGSLTLILTDGGSQTVNWPASVDWADGTAPTLTASGVDILTFVTLDGGTIWYGFAAGLDMQ